MGVKNMADDLDLDKINFGAAPFPKDPAPKSQPKKSTSSRGPGRPSKASQETEVANEIASILFMLNMTLYMRDLHQEWRLDPVTNEPVELLASFTCLNVYVDVDNKGKPTTTEAGKAFCNALAAVVVDSPFLMKVLAGGDVMGKWMQLAFATYPLVQTVITNHGIPGRTHAVQ
jgi:hypothetical protein